MKKSLIEAMNRACKHSKQFPELSVYVMDKKYKDSIVCACEWVHKERIFDGWHDVHKFVAGKMIW